MMALWRYLSDKMALLTIIFAFIAFLFPVVFLVFKDLFLWCFAATMFALGVVLHPEDARAALKRPKTIALGVTMQFWIMPMLGFTAASICTWQGVSPAIALGFIIVGCAPGAMASNVMTFLYISVISHLGVLYNEKGIFLHKILKSGTGSGRLAQKAA